MVELLEFVRITVAVCLGLLLPPLFILGWRRGNPGIFALIIFSITGMMGVFEEIGTPYAGLQLPARIVGVALILWWLMREWNDPDYPHPRKWKNPELGHDHTCEKRRYKRPWK